MCIHVYIYTCMKSYMYTCIYVYVEETSMCIHIMIIIIRNTYIERDIDIGRNTYIYRERDIDIGMTISLSIYIYVSADLLRASNV